MTEMQEEFRQLRVEFARHVKTVSDTQELQELEGEYAARMWEVVRKYIQR